VQWQKLYFRTRSELRLTKATQPPRHLSVDFKSYIPQENVFMPTFID